MSLLNAHRALLEAARPPTNPLQLQSPFGALVDLVELADERGLLESAHPWELAPSVCRKLEERSTHQPAGGWARLVGLAAGTGLLEASGDGFVVQMRAEELPGGPDGTRRELVEAFTTRLIPPAAAAALYVALDVHPLWGLELGREVGSTCVDTGPVTAPSRKALPVVKELVFGTLAGLLTSLRCLNPSARYPVDALGDVLWWSAVRARELAGADQFRAIGLPIFGEGSPAQRRMLTTRLAISDLLDFVFVPAGVARRDDSGWFMADRAALLDVCAGDWDLEQQVGWWNEALRIDKRAAC